MLQGELDMCTAPLLQRAFAVDRVRDARTVLVDVERLSFIDLSGLRPLLGLALERPAGSDFAMTSGPRKVQRLIELSGLRRHLNIVPPAVA